MAFGNNRDLPATSLGKMLDLGNALRRPGGFLAWGLWLIVLVVEHPAKLRLRWQLRKSQLDPAKPQPGWKNKSPPWAIRRMQGGQTPRER